MTRTTIDTATEISTSQKVSVGLMVATATLVLVSAAAAAVYTFVMNGQTAKSIVVEQVPVPATTPQLDPNADRVLKTAP